MRLGLIQAALLRRYGMIASNHSSTRRFKVVKSMVSLYICSSEKCFSRISSNTLYAALINRSRFRLAVDNAPDDRVSRSVLTYRRIEI